MDRLNELLQELGISKVRLANCYYLSKKSAYIIMAIQLNSKNVKKMELDDFLKNMLADRCIVTISNNK